MSLYLLATCLYLCTVKIKEKNMSKMKLKTGKVEEKVVGAYKAIENAVVGTYQKIEEKFVEKFLEVEEEVIEIPEEGDKE